MGGREHGRCLTHLAVIALHHQAPFSFSFFFFTFRFESGGGWESMRSLLEGGEGWEGGSRLKRERTNKTGEIDDYYYDYAPHRGLSPRP